MNEGDTEHRAALTAPQTCIQGTCQSDVVPTGALETYAPDWATNAFTSAGAFSWASVRSACAVLEPSR